MSDKIRQLSQDQIDGDLVAAMQLEFQNAFREVYSFHVLSSSFMAVGPMQSFLGFCVACGYLSVPSSEAADALEQRDKRIAELEAALREVQKLAKPVPINAEHSAATNGKSMIVIGACARHALQPPSGGAE